MARPQSLGRGIALIIVAVASPLAALAQESAPPAAAATPPEQAEPAPPANRSPATFVNQRRADQWMATSLQNKNVYDRNDAKIGAINDLVVDRDGRVSAVVIGVGGVLGIGEKNVGVPFADVKISMRDGNEWLVLDRTKDDLKAAAAFTSQAGSANAPSADRNFGTLDGVARTAPENKTAPEPVAREAERK